MWRCSLRLSTEYHRTGDGVSVSAIFVHVSIKPLRADAERNRRRLLDAAAELFAAKGLSVGLDEIARHAGVGVGTAYRRFPDKAELIQALFDDRVAQLLALAEAGLADEDPWRGFVGFLDGATELQANNRA